MYISIFLIAVAFVASILFGERDIPTIYSDSDSDSDSEFEEIRSHELEELNRNY